MKKARKISINTILISVIYFIGVSSAMSTDNHYKKMTRAMNKQNPVYDYPIFSMDMADFYSYFNYDLPDLKSVKKAVDDKDYEKAGKALQNYFLKKRAFAQKVLNVAEFSVSQIKQTSAETLLKRTYSYQGATHTFKNGIDWLYNPTGRGGSDLNPEWVVNTVRFRGMPTLANAYRSTKDERFALELIYLMKDFISKYPVPLLEKQPANIPKEIDWLMYSKLSVSSRVGVMTQALFSVLESPNLKSSDFVVILQSIYNHLLRMEKYPYLTYHNMGVVDAQVLQKIAVALPEFKKSAHWVGWALSRGLDQMKNVVYEDGVEKELCPRYHQGVMGNFASFMTVASNSGAAVPSEYTNRLKGMAEFLVKISRPDGTIPAFNEMVQSQDDGKEVRKKVRGIASLTNDKGVLSWFGSDGKIGIKPGYESVALEWAGYYAMRSGWAKNDNYMVVKAGPYGLAHQQEDKLSFELFANGELFFVDPGFYLYNRASAWRKYYQSSLAHNTLVPDGLTQYRYGQRSLYENIKPNDALWISNGSYDFLSASYLNGYAPYQQLHEDKPAKDLLMIAHQRDILFIKPGVWLILDWMSPADANEHQYEALFQSQYPVSGSGEDLVVKGKQSSLYILPFRAGGEPLKSSVATAQEAPIKRGWIYHVEKTQNEALATGVVAHKASGNTVQAYFILTQKHNSSGAPSVKAIQVNGGIGAKLKMPDGQNISFIAQKQAGMPISAAGLETSGRLKLIVSATSQVIEVHK